MYSGKILQTLLFLFLTCLLAGCGEKTVTGTSSTASVESATCTDCHNTPSPVTGKLIGDEWRASVHNTKNAAPCAACHEPAPGHPNSCNRCHAGTPTGKSERHDVVLNPDASLKCGNCHTFSGSKEVSFNGISKDVMSEHVNTTTAMYVSSQYEGKCRNCHNPHDVTSAMNICRAWARSGHGNVAAVPWNDRDFKSYSGDCNRCHTTTGFIKYVTTGDSKPWGTASDKTKEVLACNACHTDYSYKVRTLPAASVAYTGATIMYPDVGASNICLNCHTGRESGATIKNIQRNYTSASFINSHYMTAGGIVFGKIGYEYDGRDYADPAGSGEIYRHRYIGTSNALGISSAKSTVGPCVGCHISNKTQPGETHTFKPYIVNSGALSPTCETTGCHGATATRPTPRDQTWLRDTWQLQYQSALSALNYFLSGNKYRKMFYTSSYPYFMGSATSAAPLKKWHSVASPVTNTTTSGSSNMGAAFNYNILIHDKGGVAHNRFYTRRLIYDAIDWLDDNMMNYSVGTTLNALSGTGDTEFKKNSATYLVNAGTNNANIGKPAERY